MKVTYYVAASVDGFIADAAGGLGWLSAVEAEDEDYGYGEFLSSVDGLVMGRRTFEDILSFGPWPYGNRPARVFSRRRKSERTEPGIELPARFTDAPPVEAIRELEEAGVGHLWLVGGGALAGGFLEDGLLTDIVLSVVPVVLGAGVPLFHAMDPRRPLGLVSSRAFPSGLVQSTYQVRPRG